MLWIIWMCAWWLVITLGLYIDALRRDVSGEKADKGGVAFECLVLLAIWILGAVKFWPQ